MRATLCHLSVQELTCALLQEMKRAMLQDPHLDLGCLGTSGLVLAAAAAVVLLGLAAAPLDRAGF